ncbi:MAG TPA: ABC transporter permease, partial [Opitutaceae bacterium]
KAEKAFAVVTEYTNPDESKRPFTEADARQLIRDRKLRYAVIIPDATSGMGLTLKILSDPVNEIEAQTVNGILQKTLFSNVPQLLLQSLQARAKAHIGEERLKTFNSGIARSVVEGFGGNLDEITAAVTEGDLGADTSGPGEAKGAGGTPDFFSRIVKIEQEQVGGAQVKSPGATRLVGGWAIMFLMFALSGGAISLFEEKKSGMLQRLLAMPVTRADILWSRFVFGVLLGLVQLITIFVFGSFLYGIEILPHLGGLALVAVATAAACTALGMLIASVSSSPDAASGLSTFVILTMSACGGAWFPISFMPDFMQVIARFTVTYWAIDGFTQVLWARNSLVQLLPTLGILLAIAGGVMSVAIWRFNRGRLFD